MEVIAGVIIDNVIKGLSPIEGFNLLCNLNDDLRKMKSTVSAIKAVLLDAEERVTDHKISQSHQISDWLVKLKDVLYDADDLLDELSFDALRRKVMTRNHTAKKVRTFFSRSNQVFFGLKMGLKMKEIRKRVDEISYEKNAFKLQPNCSSEIPFEYKRETHSFVRESDVIGREMEKKDIIRYLLDSSVEDDVSVIPIVGIGGLGKTTLAQLVYNDKFVLENFELNMWVCVSDDFSVKHIAQKMLGRETNGGQIERVLQELRSNIRDKRFLLVLDDVWNGNPQLWHELKSSLMEGAKGSKIIVTTRSIKVADIMRTVPPFMLSGLDDETSRKLFCQMAFKNGEKQNNSELVAIGEDIVKKCAGVPLAIRTIGSLLSLNLTKSTWLEFKDKELLKIEEGERQIFSILKLSYNHLPSQLKSCFAYCSLFPKNFTFRKQTLIQLWMAQGFIQQSDTIRNQEDVGHDYFMSLLLRSFFQDVRRNFYGEICWCKMHDLAIFVARDEYIVVSEGSEVNIKDRTRHLSFGFHLNDWRKVLTSLLKANKLRTFLLPCQFPGILSDESVCHSYVSNLKGSRVLDFRLFIIKKIPESVGKLKHLRYLDLSYSYIKKLPQSIANLLNLQTLKLNWCFQLEVLPRDINKLVNLIHLELYGTQSLGCMPYGLGQLTCLQTLTKFILNMDGGARISELRLLNNLSGSLTIYGLEQVRRNTMEIKSAKLLLEKQYLRELHYCWAYDESLERNELEEVAYKDEMILEALQPHPSIKDLTLFGFRGKSLPHWIGNLSSLQELRLWNCPMLTERCIREEGEDWPKIAHIPSVGIADHIPMVEVMTSLDYNMIEACTDEIITLIKKVLPLGHRMPDNFYQTKRLVSELSCGYKKIDCYPSECMLYYGDNEDQRACKFCGESRFRDKESRKRQKELSKKQI